MDWNRKSGKEMLDIKEKNGVVWLEFPALAKTGMDFPPGWEASVKVNFLL